MQATNLHCGIGKRQDHSLLQECIQLGTQGGSSPDGVLCQWLMTGHNGNSCLSTQLSCDKCRCVRINTNINHIQGLLVIVKCRGMKYHSHGSMREIVPSNPPPSQLVIPISMDMKINITMCFKAPREGMHKLSRFSLEQHCMIFHFHSQWLGRTSYRLWCLLELQKDVALQRVRLSAQRQIMISSVGLCMFQGKIQSLG